MSMEKDLTDKLKAWNTILQSLKNAGDIDLRLWSRRDGYGNWFKVSSSGSHLLIQTSEKQTPSCDINQVRAIDFPQFEFVAKHYNSYIKGEKRVREKMRDGCQNSSYIISLIVRFL